MKSKGGSIETVQADLSRPDEVRRSINEAASKLGGIDMLWAHAGTPGPAGSRIWIWASTRRRWR